MVLAALRRSPNEFASYLNKLFKVDDHMGVAIAGLTADARTLVKHLRTEALEHEFTYSSKIQSGRLASELSDMLQRCTQSYVRRPYGVGLLIASYDSTGSHLIEISPRLFLTIYISLFLVTLLPDSSSIPQYSGTHAEYYAMAIGARSQSAKTYMEKHVDEFSDCNEEELIKHALKALSGCISGDKELDTSNTCVMVVGEGKSLQLIDGDSVQPYLDAIDVEEGGGDEQVETGGIESTEEAKGGGEGDDAMETS